MPAKSRIVTDHQFPTIGIIAGAGVLFSLVHQTALTKGLQPVIVSFKDAQKTARPFEEPHLQTSLGKIGEVLDFLKEHGVKKLIFAGKIARPSFSSLSVDATGLRWVKKLGSKIIGGDDALLKGLTGLLEQEGFEIISPRDFLPNLVLKSGLYAEAKPTEMDDQDIIRGQEVLKALSGADVGQACIIQEGLVLGVEAIEGTQKLIERCASLKPTKQGGVLVKIAKTNQSTLVDLPTIGVETIEAICNSGLNGLAISAHTTQVLECNRVIDLCNQYGLFLKVI